VKFWKRGVLCAESSTSGIGKGREGLEVRRGCILWWDPDYVGKHHGVQTGSPGKRKKNVQGIRGGELSRRIFVAYPSNQEKGRHG